MLFLLLLVTWFQACHPFVTRNYAGSNIRWTKTNTPPPARTYSGLWTAINSVSSPTETVDATNTDAADVGYLGAWIPVGSVSALRDVVPAQIEIMGQKFVVWNNPNNEEEWSVLADVCPHRLAPLSQGRIDPVSGCVECPYHGWQFDTSGAVTQIPQLDPQTTLEASVKANENLNARNFPVHLAGDLIFTFLPSSLHGESFPSTLLPEEMYIGLSEQIAAGAKWYVRELPYSVDFLIENFMDPGHIPFAHHGLQGVREDGAPIPMNTVVSNFTHIEVGYKDQIKGVPREGIVSFQRPTYYHFRTTKENGVFARILMIHTVPVAAGRSRVLFQSVLPKWIPIWLAHGASNRFLNTDTWLHDAERVARAISHEPTDNIDLYQSASQSDVGVKAFRKWWAKYGMANAPPHSFGPSTMEQLGPRTLSRPEQIDPWEYHTKHCSICRKALTRFKKIETGGLVVAIFSAAIMRRWPILRGLLVAGGLGSHFMSKRIATFIEGNPRMSGIDDRSAAHMGPDKNTKKDSKS
mmetsp:Transcript_20669/g.31553  ORF Transcript_20669/g.31553 Transcript_20669/m.31553 type:complete len:523 (+) Transcript_20669:201-1769(+)